MRKLILASLTISSTLAAQAPGGPPRTTPLRGSLERRLAQLLDVPPFERATWGLYVVDDRARVLYQRNADRFAVPASNTKLVVTAAATVLLPPDYRVTTSLYVNGRVDAGVLHGDLVLYGRGDPTWSQRCYSVDTLAPGACDSAFTAIDAIADSVRARGLRRITGKLVGDGSYFEPTIVHPGWNAWDLNWWYAAPVSGLGFHDNSVDFKITPGPAVDTPPVITWSPDLALVAFANRARTVPARFSNVNSARSGDHVITGGVSTAGPGVILKSTLLSWKPSPETGAAYHQFKSHAFQPGWTIVGSKYEPSPTSFPVMRRSPRARTESAMASIAVNAESHAPGASVSTE